MENKSDSEHVFRSRLTMHSPHETWHNSSLKSPLLDSTSREMTGNEGKMQQRPSADFKPATLQFRVGIFAFTAIKLHLMVLMVGVKIHRSLNPTVHEVILIASDHDANNTVMAPVPFNWTSYPLFSLTISCLHLCCDLSTKRKIWLLAILRLV